MGKPPKYWARLKKVVICPEGYLNGKEYSERIGISLQTIMKACREGRIPEKWMLVVTPPDKLSKSHLVINWNNTAYDYVLGQYPIRRHKDFKENPKKEFKPIKLTEPEQSAEDIPETELFARSGMAYEMVTDLSSAKYRNEQLKIERQELELRHANNELIEVSAVIQERAEQAVQVRVAIQSAVQRLTPLLAVESDIKEVKRILLEQLNKALKSLGDEEVKA